MATNRLSSAVARAARVVIPRPARAAMKWSYRASVDVLDALFRPHTDLRPPRRLIFVGDGDYAKIGKEFLSYFVELSHLKPNESVLDIGCGVGRMAVPLLSYLTEGSYDGIDIVPKGIAWCKRKITPLNPHFRFRLADVSNKAYNPRGKQSASEFVFPFEDNRFDFVFLTSVFTHMLPADVEHYLVEIARVLKPGGRCLATYFLLNAESSNLMAANRSTLDFRYDGRGYKMKDKTNPEVAVAYDEELVRQMHTKHGLPIDGSIHYGSWCGRKSFLSYQDIVLSSKR